MLRSANDAAIRSAIGVGTTDAPTFLAQTLTGQSLTGTQATSLVDLSATWNTTGTPSALKLNVTDTASNAASKLMDLQVGGVTQFQINKVGVLGRGLAAGISFNANGAGRLALVSNNGGGGIYFDANDAHVSNVGFIGWDYAGNPGSGACDVKLYRDAAGILAQRNGVTAQAFRVYNSTDATPATNYDRAVFDFKTTTNTLRIGTENGGTYTTARPIEFVTGGVVRMSIAGTGLTTIDGIAVSRGAGTNTLNIAIGGGLVNNTTGSRNSAIGVQALQNNSTGGSNSAIGAQALQSNSTGYNNSALGVNALQSNSTGGNNSALGVNALFGNSTGLNNSAIGFQAGRYLADGATANASGANSIYLGADTKALADGQANQVVIGFGVIGLGSHSTTINNTSTVLTKIQGTSAHVLDVSGTIRLTPPASVTPANNGELMVEGTSNTTLTLKLKGTDGIVRSVALTLA